MHSIFFKKMLSLALLLLILSSGYSISGQKKRTAAAPKKQPTAAPKPDCNGGWSGTVTFSKTLEESGASDEPTSTVNPRNRAVLKWSNRMVYNGKMIVDGSGKSPVASANVEYGEARMEHGVLKEWGSCRAYNDEHWFITDNKREQTTTGSGSAAAKSFSIYVDELNGTYKFSFQFPDIKGEYSNEQHLKKSGFCQPINNKPYDLSERKPTFVDGERASISNQKIDPRRPDELTGSVTIDENDYSDPKRVKSPITVISWKLRRCPPPLMIADVKFSQPLYPSPSTWIGIDKNDRAIDGNQVKITATIVNLSSAERSATVNFKELKENIDLPDAQVPVILAPREEKEVEYVWDTSGYAWKEASPVSQPEINRQIEVRIPDDAMTEYIEIAPKPVVIVPGLWSNQSIGKLAAFFKNMPTANWTTEVAPVDVKKFAVENMVTLDKTVREIQQRENAWHVDLAAHSTGGIAARAYVHALMPTMFDGKPAATRLVMIGTPNMGTPCAAGAGDLITRVFKSPPNALKEVTFEAMLEFNRSVYERKGTRFAALVGNAFSPICELDVPGDGVTPNRSAIWTLREWAYASSPARHEDMPGEQSNFLQLLKWLAVSPKGSHAPDASN